MNKRMDVRRSRTLSGLLTIPLAVAVALVLLSGQPATPALANFHIAHIDEIMSGVGGDPGLAYVEIQQDAGGQEVVSGSKLTMFHPDGSFNVLVVPNHNVTFQATAGRRWIMAEDGAVPFLTASGITPDFTFTMPALPADRFSNTNGMICWGKPTFDSMPSDFGYVDCVAYGNYSGTNVPATSTAPTYLPAGDGTLSLQRVSNTSNDLNDFKLRCPSPQNDANAAGGFGACSTATLTVTKLVTNNDGGAKVPADFSLHLKSGAMDIAGSPHAGSAAGLAYTVVPGTYTLSEDPMASYTGTFSGDCNAGGMITLAANDTKTCTITNDDQKPTLTVRKVVINDTGGINVASDFSMHVKSGGVDVGGSPQAGSGAGTMYSLAVGAYTVSEDPLNSYTAAFSAACSPGGGVTLAFGDAKTCTVTNDDPCTADLDGDGVCDLLDNCPGLFNPTQANTDNEIDNGPGVASRDTSVPNAVADTEGDACETDGDADNDGLPDAEDIEPLGATGICAAFAGFSDGHPSPAGGDLTNDDNGNGTPAPADGADNGPSWDTDNDGVRDGVECQLGTNPRLASSKPIVAACGGATDADLDGLPASAERCKWGTSDTNTDSDTDTRKDCVEANDTDGNGISNFTGDTINSAKAANNIIGKTMDFDLDGNGSVNFTGDTILSAKIANHVGGICL